jgi:hypothetical protein
MVAEMAENKTRTVRRGRRREFDGTPVSVRLPSALHDALSREAIRQQRDLSDVIRERLARPPAPLRFGDERL